MDYFGGIDIGSSTAKFVITDASGRLVAKAMKRSGVDYGKTAQELLATVCSSAAIDRSAIVRIVSTGYGRGNVAWSNGTMTEIACHGKGAFFHFPWPITVIDIGAQDSKVIHLDGSGKRTGFKMNRKCAAGTGAFLEEIAHKLDIAITELNGLAERSSKELTLGSFCTVFAATEVIEKIRAGEAVQDIVRAAFGSVTKRIVEMDSLYGRLVTTGGVVAHNPFLAHMLGQAFSTEAFIAPDAQYIGALGAALFAMETA
jgi:predicted CoA-substrate-specific enzyme activase